MIDSVDGKTLPGAPSTDARFAETYQRYRPLVYGTCLRILKDPAEAEDATQETFLSAYRQRDALPDKLGAWLRVVARNQSLDMRRRTLRNARLASELRTLSPASIDPGDRAVDRARLIEALDNLGPRERAVLLASVVEDRSVGTVASQLGLTYMGAAQVLHRAKRRVQRLLAEGVAILLPFLPARFRGRGRSPRMLQFSQVAVRLPEMATLALVAAVLVAGPLLGPSQPPPVSPRVEAAGVTGAVPGGSSQAAAASTRQAAAAVPVPTAAPTSVGASITVPPVAPLGISLTGLLTVNALSPGGATVNFNVEVAGATGSVQVSCSPGSGSTFPIGTTTVNCTARDSAGKTGSASFAVTVTAAAPLTLQLPGQLTVNSPFGDSLTANFNAVVTGGYGTLTVSCSPPGGSVFPIGSTTVSCTGRDAYGQSTSKSFVVVVVSGPARIAAVVTEIAGMHLDTTTALSLTTKLANASAALANRNIPMACGQVGAFSSQVTAESGQHLTPTQASQLIADATDVRQILGC